MQVRQATLAHVPAPNELAALASIGPQLVLVFGSVALMDDPALVPALKAAFGAAELAGCTTAGEIGQTGVTDAHLVITALHFDAPGFSVAVTDQKGMDDSRGAGARLATMLQQPGLHNVLVLGQGVSINGSALIEGLQAGLPAGVVLSGGLAGDGGSFSRTLTLSGRGVSATQTVAIGFSAPNTLFNHGCFHGWKPFGPSRRVTRSQGNVLYELDGQSALEIYKRYLGEHAAGLPASGLLFPFEMLGEDQNAVGLIRTILAVDEASGSLTLAGDIVENGYLRLMHASTDSLVEGAQTAAESAFSPSATANDSVALLVSCVGRKLVMGARVDEEVEAVADVFGRKACVTGFYSNGEISPLVDGLTCRLHNQTMTITHISEVAA